jgi:hypothetical protein
VKTSATAILSLVAALSLGSVANGQSLADVAKKTEEERAKAKQGVPARVFTNEDLVDLPPSRAPAPVEPTAVPARSTSNEATTPSAPATTPTGAVRVNRTYTVNGNALETTLSLALRGPQGNQLPITLLFRAVHEDRSRSNEPSELTLRFAISSTYVGPLDFKAPHVILVLDDGQAPADVIAFGTDGPLGGVMSSVAIEPFDLAFLARLGQATTLRGRLFNLSFVLTPEQVRSISEFSQRARRRAT